MANKFVSTALKFRDELKSLGINIDSDKLLTGELSSFDIPNTNVTDPTGLNKTVINLDKPITSTTELNKVRKMIDSLSEFRTNYSDIYGSGGIQKHNFPANVINVRMKGTQTAEFLEANTGPSSDINNPAKNIASISLSNVSKANMNLNVSYWGNVYGLATAYLATPDPLADLQAQYIARASEAIVLNQQFGKTMDQATGTKYGTLTRQMNKVKYTLMDPGKWTPDTMDDSWLNSTIAGYKALGSEFYGDTWNTKVNVGFVDTSLLNPKEVEAYWNQIGSAVQTIPIYNEAGIKIGVEEGTKLLRPENKPKFAPKPKTKKVA